MAGSKAVGTMERFWPLPGDRVEVKAKPMTKERYEEILKRHKVKVK